MPSWVLYGRKEGWYSARRRQKTGDSHFEHDGMGHAQMHSEWSVAGMSPVQLIVAVASAILGSAAGRCGSLCRFVLGMTALWAPIVAGLIEMAVRQHMGFALIGFVVLYMMCIWVPFAAGFMGARLLRRVKERPREG